MKRLLTVYLVVVACGLGIAVVTHDSATAELTRPKYQHRAQHNRHGTGKFYLGREIARVMGHRGWQWLERPERELEEKPSLLIKSLNLKPGQVVADIGAGSGYMSFRLAGVVGLKGKVWAVDIQQEMLDIIDSRAMIKALRPAGRLVFVEYRLEDSTVPIKLIHKMSAQQVKKEMSVHPEMTWKETLDVLSRQHIIVFEKYE